ncbi:MAG: metallophosphoesterase [Clostridia bacterium]|nr:metallophosphoesterase [Clostridia bacterium]
MIYFTGDTHGERARFSDGKRLGDSAWTKDDYLIVCGDFGYVMYDDEAERAFLDELAKKPYTICFCDGNHENFTTLNAYPCEVWNGGRVHKIRPNILHLMRGQIYTLQGKKIFVMGGAYSIDKATKKNQGLHWEEELPVASEYQEAIDNLRAAAHKVDYIVSHTAPQRIIRLMGFYPDGHDAELTGFLDWVLSETAFKKWYFGHWHMDKEITDRVRALWLDVAAEE